MTTPKTKIQTRIEFLEETLQSMAVGSIPDDFSGQWFSIREECYQAALRQLDQLHPLTYEDTPEGRRYIRKGL